MVGWQIVQFIQGLVLDFLEVYPEASLNMLLAALHLERL